MDAWDEMMAEIDRINEDLRKANEDLKEVLRHETIYRS